MVIVNYERKVDRLLAAFVIWLAEIVGVTLLLGLTGFLQLSAVMLTTSLLFIITLAISLNRDLKVPNYRSKLRKVYKLKANKTIFALFLLAVIAVLWLIFIGLIFPPSH